MVVFLFGNNTELHVHGVPYNHKPNAKENNVVVPAHSSPVCKLGDKC